MAGGNSRQERVVLASQRSRDSGLLRLRLVRRMKDISETYTYQTITEMASWYENFHNRIITEITGDIENHIKLATFAILSPGMDPESNIVAAQTVINNVLNGGSISNIKAYPHMVRIAREIVITGDTTLIKGPKTRSFYKSLMTKGKTDDAAVDRWAAREFSPYDKKIKIKQSNGTYKEAWRDVTLTLGEYRKFQGRIQTAAEYLGIYAAELQAILWVDRRTRENSRG